MAAPSCQGLPYPAEILADGEYTASAREDAPDLRRKLADCELIVQAVNAHRALAGLSDADIVKFARAGGFLDCWLDPDKPGKTRAESVAETAIRFVRSLIAEQATPANASD